MKALFIAEKTTLMNAVKQVYLNHKNEIPYECAFLPQAGHLLTLKYPEEIDPALKKWSWDNLPFFPEDYGGWKYKIITGTGPAALAKGRYEAIRDELKTGNYDFVIHGGDADQEGELLVRIVLNQLNCKLPVKRYWSNDMTEARILDSLKHLRDDDNDPMLVNLTKAGFCRQHTDYLYGINISQATSLKMGGRAAIGRVKTWMLGMVCRRENEIANFVPTTEYGVKVSYAEGFDGQLYEEPKNTTTKDKNNNEDDSSGYIYFPTEKEATDYANNLGKVAVVEECTTKKTETFAPKLYKLSTLQIAAGKYGYAADKTLETIQSLYEKGYLSYPRTDCEYLSSNEKYEDMIKSAMAVPELVPFIQTISKATIAKVKSTKKWVDDKALQEHGHSAIVPTTKKPDITTFSQAEKDIYTLVCRQFVAIFLPSLVTEKIVVIASSGNDKFRSSGKTVIRKGYTEIFGQNIANTSIPICQKGEKLNIINATTCTKTTKCPSHLSDTDLIAIASAPHKYLEDGGLKSLGDALHIGTPATQAEIIKRLISVDKYLTIKKEGKRDYLTPTQMGLEIYENLKDSDLCKTDTTGKWEIMLEEIRKGQMSDIDFEQLMRKNVETMVSEIFNSNMKLFSNAKKRSTSTSVGICPLCGDKLMENDKGFYCGGYKNGCKASITKILLEAPITKEDFEKIYTGQPVEKEFKKNGAKWISAIVYNKEAEKLEFQNIEKESRFECPKCHKKLIDKGRLLECSCDFKLWKTVCGKELKEGDIEDLLTKGHTRTIKGLKSKKGNKFDAKLVMKKDFSGTEFKFD